MQASKRLLIYLLVAFECFCGRWFSKTLAHSVLIRVYILPLELVLIKKKIRH
jgi:hypothetical protein